MSALERHRHGECSDDPEHFLAPGIFVDSVSRPVVAFADRMSGRGDAISRARHLYLAVRDGFRYNPYRIGRTPKDFKASTTVTRRDGFCVTKAALLAAVARAAGIPARLGFADVRNHLTSPRLREMMGGSDIFVFHGYTELYLGGKWLKATPAFDRRLCERLSIPPLEFDGSEDSILHAFDSEGRRHMEYLRDRGVTFDLPFAEMIAAWVDAYGPELVLGDSAASGGESADFENEVAVSLGDEATASEDYRGS